MRDPTELSLMVKQSRLMLGISQVELAHRLGVRPTTVWRWEHAASSPHRVYVKKLESMLQQRTVEAEP